LGAVAKIKAEFQKRDVKIMAVSVDPLDSHHGWIKDINETQACTMNLPVGGFGWEGPAGFCEGRGPEHGH
jgi:alkyl hydroperoxide reductase subunit AhpC